MGQSCMGYYASIVRRGDLAVRKASALLEVCGHSGCMEPWERLKTLADQYMSRDSRTAIVIIEEMAGRVCILETG